MNESNKANFGVLVGALCSAYGIEVSKPLLMAYWLGLSDLDYGDFSKAIEQAIRESDRMPSPAQVRKIATGQHDITARAQLAWLELNRVIDRVGGYGSPAFNDQTLIATVASLGGWQEICNTKQSEFDSFVRPKFMATYASLFCVRDLKAPRLIGIHEQAGNRLRSVESLQSIGTVARQLTRIACDRSPNATPERETS